MCEEEQCVMSVLLHVPLLLLCMRRILEKGVCLRLDTIFYPVYVQLTSCTASYAYTGGTYLH